MASESDIGVKRIEEIVAEIALLHLIEGKTFLQIALRQDG
jgi:hypothetical protein